MKYPIQAYLFLLSLLFNFSLAAQQTVQIISTSCSGMIEATITTPACHNGSDGSISLNLLEDNGSSQINWLNLPVTANSDATSSYDLSPGTYRAEITNTFSCADTIALLIANPARLVTTTIDKEDVRCKNEQNGVIILNPDNPSYVQRYYLNGQTHDANISRFENLSPGNYTIQIEDVNGCVEERFAEISEPEKLELRTVKEDVTCPGGTDGKLLMGAVGGTGSYQFSLNNQPFQDVLAYNDLSAGIYDVYVKDYNSCISHRSVTVEEPPAPVINFDQKDVTCPGGQDAHFIVIIETVGLAQDQDYEYSLDDINYQPDSLFDNLSAGSYTAFARNKQGCVSSAQVFIDQPAEPNISFDKEDVSCPGGADAHFIVIIETVGLTVEQDYEYSLDDVNYQPDSLFDNLKAGIYTVFARNANGCVEQASVVIEEPETAELRFGKQDVTCPGGADGSFIVIIETVGLMQSGPYEFSLDGINYQPDSLFENLSAGLYEVFIRNGAQCIQTAWVLIEEPQAPQLEWIVDPPSCPGSSDARLQIIVNQGVGNDDFEYSLNGFDYQPINQFDMLGSGLHTIYLRDTSGCSYSLAAYIDEPDSPIYSITTSDVSCFGRTDGSILVEIISGNLPFQFALDDIPYQNQAQFDSLRSGIYTLYLRDAAGCVFSQSVQIAQPTALQNQFVSSDATCSQTNGYITAMAIGGTPSYSYQWNTGEQSAVLANIAAGMYELTITDAAGCTLTSQHYLQNIEGPQLTGSQSDVSCFQMTDGAIDLQINSQVSVDHIIWSTGVKQEDLLDLPAGNYSVTVVDINQCSSSKHFTIDEPQELKIAGEIQQQGNSGRLELEVSGGTAPYTYAWSDGSIAPIIEQLLPGQYSVTITDDKGCVASRSYQLQPNPNQSLEDNINVYPIPASDQVYIYFDLPLEQEVSIQLFDELGRKIWALPASRLLNERVTLEVGGLAAAVYYVHIQVDDQSLTRKLVVFND